MHHGAAVVLTNSDRSKFVLQQKDEFYPPYPLAFSLWGGAIEDDDASAEEAARRETLEELPSEIASLVLAQDFHEVADVVIESKERYRVTLFEVILSDNCIDECESWKVNEGKGAVLVPRAEMLNKEYVWNLEQAVKVLLER